MKFDLVTKSVSLSALMAILILVASVMVASPGRAALMEYTYTGKIFTTEVGTPPVPNPAGDHLTISFNYSYPLPLPPPYTAVTIPDFTMTCGDLQISTTTPGAIVTNKWVASYFSGLPEEWSFTITAPVNGAIWALSSYAAYGTHDVVSLQPPSPPYSREVYSPGTWTVAPVPAPGAALLFGSGLIWLAWLRRRDRSEE